MTIQITLSAEDEAKLRARAEAASTDLDTYARAALLRDIDRLSLADAVAPLHEAARAANLTESEVDDLIERGLNEVRSERRRTATP